MTEFAYLRSKIWNYLTDDNDEIKKAKGTRKSIIKRNLNLKIIKIVKKQINLKRR